jgi:hypothetical protein
MLRPTDPAKGTRMHFGHAQYLPIALPLFALLASALTLLLILVQIRVLRYAYMQLGVSSGAAFFLSPLSSAATSTFPSRRSTRKPW